MSSVNGSSMARRTIESVVIAVLLLAGAATAARAEPYISLRAGVPCASCHVNQTGGGQRNGFGTAYGLTRLPARPIPLPEGTEPFDGAINSHLSIGADYRGVNQARFAASGDTDTFATQEGNLYADLKLLPDRLHLCADLSVAPNAASSRELFALIDHIPGQLYLKAGRFFAPYGWRLLDDDAFIRARTGFTFQAPDDGVELGWQPGDFSAALAVTNGNGGATDDNTNKRVSMLTTWSHPRVRVGASFASNRQGDASVLLGGLLAGVKLGSRLVALGEVDAGREENDTLGTTTREIIGYGEADLLVGKGMNLKAAFDYLDPDRSRSGDEVNRVSLGVEYAVIPYTQIRLLWRRTDRPPLVGGVTFEDDREAILELHLFL